jgi:hypothetical protein
MSRVSCFASLVLGGKVMKKFLVVACLAAMVIATQSTAWAGGGGAKSDPTITVTNASKTNKLAVIIDPSSALMGKVTDGSVTLAEFQAAGGVVVNPTKASKAFKVKIGTHVVAAAYVLDESSTPVDLGKPGGGPYPVVKKQALKLTAEMDAGGGVTLK